MHAKTSLALTTCAALAEQALALNSHRHFHRDVSGDVPVEVPAEVPVETIWTTVYEDPAATSDVIVPATVTIPVTVIKEVMAPQTTLTPSVRPTPQETPSSSSGAALPVKIASTPVADPPPATSSTSSGGSGPKKGIAFNDVALANNFKGKCPDCSWAFSWGTWPDGLDPSLDFYPMLRKLYMDKWAEDMARLEKTRKPKKLLSFNEPDMPTEKDYMTVEEAVSLHTDHMKNFVNKYEIGAPSVSNSPESNQGLDWLKKFVDACKGDCHYDFCVVHWYWDTANAENLVKHIGAAYDVCKKPIMLNEFGTNQNIDSANFMKKAIPLLDKCPNLIEYSPFMVREDRLMSGPNSLSDSGEAYIAA